jgi:hypothetical protein
LSADASQTSESASGGSPEGSVADRPSLPRLELRVERLNLRFRFTFAFHAREVRFEAAQGEASYERLFPETFSFNASRHDPTELFLQLDDLYAKTGLLAAHASARDARNLVTRMLSEAPRYLDGLCRHLEAAGSLAPVPRQRFHQDIALLCQILLRFIDTHEFEGGRQLRVAGFSLRRRIYESLRILVDERVESDYLEAYIAGDVDLVDPTDDPTESGFFQVLETGEKEAADRILLRMAERSFYLWLEGVCLDEKNQAFEKDDSPFDSREMEVLSAISVRGVKRIDRSRDLVPFLRRSDRNVRRILGKLERWFLRIYDIRHSSAVIHHAALLQDGNHNSDRILTWHTPMIHGSVLVALVLPFVAAATAYRSAPHVFDLICSAEVFAVNATAIWFLLYRFCWKRDLSFFHASVPRIGAGIIVGYLPVFLIDEVWDLASRPNIAIGTVAVVLGLVTLLYIYVEIARRIPDTTVAFARARSLVLLGIVQAFGVGVVMTSLIGRYMVVRNWSPPTEELSLSALRETLPPMVGQLPHVVGTEPFYAFPSALLLMTFLSFFIGVFLQLMWEELPITEPL